MNTKSFDIFDIDTNEIFAHVEYMGDTEYIARGSSAKGIEWSDWVNNSRPSDFESTLPPYVGVRESDKGLREQASRFMRLISVKSLSSMSILPSLRDIQLIGISPDMREGIIDYKARAFVSDTDNSSMLNEIRLKGLKLNPLNGSINSFPSISMEDFSPDLTKKYAPGMVRSTGISVISGKASRYDGLHCTNHNKVETKSIFRSMRRIVSQRFDPNAIDADGDKLVQEGTPFQRPAMPRSAALDNIGAARNTIMSRRGTPASTSPTNVGKTTMRSSGAISRGTTPARARTSNIERVIRSQSASGGKTFAGSKSITKKIYTGNPGSDRAHPDDGKIWASLTPEEKSTVSRRARALEDQRWYQLTGVTPGGQNMPFRKRFLAAQKAYEKEGRTLNGPTKDFLEEMQTWVEEYVNKDSIPQKAKLEVQRFYDELLALYNMRTKRGSDNYEYLEHLHPSGRAFLFDDAKRADGAKTSVSHKSKAVTSESTAFGRAGGYEQASPIAQNTRKPEPPAPKSTDERVSGLVDSGARRIIDRLLNPKPKKKK